MSFHRISPYIDEILPFPGNGSPLTDFLQMFVQCSSPLRSLSSACLTFDWHLQTYQTENEAFSLLHNLRQAQRKQGCLQGDLIQCHAYADLCRHSCNGITACLGCQGRRTGNTWVHFDNVVPERMRIQCELYIASPSTLRARISLSALSRSIWYSLFVKVWDGQTTIESPVWIPTGSRFSMLHTVIAVSLESRMTSYSISLKPLMLFSTNT